MLALLGDIGSTYTKLTAVDLTAARLVAGSSVPTTVENLAVGVRAALHQLRQQLPARTKFALRRAASSAAGGLKLVAVGLVPELTGEAARLAALGAGAKVLASFGHSLQSADLAEILALQPDVLLLSGGTDGGDHQVMLDNARSLAASQLSAAVVVAGNREATPQAVEVLRAAGYTALPAANVLPRLGQLAVQDARRAIRELFLSRIVLGKGLDQVMAEFGGDVVMPTPVAVLQGLQLLAANDGELLAVDVGGATTDVYSLASGQPQDDAVIPVGLQPPFAHRTVEADLGLRISAPVVAERQLAVLERRAQRAGVDCDWVSWTERLRHSPSWLPESSAEQLQELILAATCVEQAVNRHVGRVESMVTPYGRSWLLRGKDLRSLSWVIGIGGIFRRSPHAGQALRAALQDGSQPELLKPLPQARLAVDQDYLLAAGGLLAESHPHCALQLMRSSLRAIRD